MVTESVVVAAAWSPWRNMFLICECCIVCVKVGFHCKYIHKCMFFSTAFIFFIFFSFFGVGGGGWGGWVGGWEGVVVGLV